jgi:CheY-like chemotaxis protein
MLRDIFESVGDVVLTIDHAGTALALLPEAHADLILVDLMLPDQPGAHLAAQLREVGHAHTPMIAVSADPVNLSSARRLGVFQELVRKPFDIDELLRLADVYSGRYITETAR